MTTTDTTPVGDLAAIQRTFKTISKCVWTVAGGVMIYGIPIAYELLAGHDVPKGIAWMLSVLVDSALVVGLVATPVLARFGIPAGWVGTLRWVSGLFTWALQTTGSWIKQDYIGVLLHSFGPVILFVVVEAAASFQRKMSAKIAELEAETRSTEAKRAAEAAEREELRRKVAELVAQRGDTEAMKAIAARAEAEAEELRSRIEAVEARSREDLTALTNHLSTQHREEVQRLRDRHREEVARLKAEKSTVSLIDYRMRTSSKTPAKTNPATSSKSGKQPAMSDEEAVQALIDANEDPNHEWVKADVRRITGVGFGARMDRLIALWHDAAKSRALRPREEASDEASEEATA